MPPQIPPGALIWLRASARPSSPRLLWCCLFPKRPRRAYGAGTTESRRPPRTIPHPAHTPARLNPARQIHTPARVTARPRERRRAQSRAASPTRLCRSGLPSPCFTPLRSTSGRPRRRRNRQRARTQKTHAFKGRRNGRIATQPQHFCHELSQWSFRFIVTAHSPNSPLSEAPPRCSGGAVEHRGRVGVRL